jgi:hypothetical protein
MCGCGEGACWATVLAVSVATASCKKNLERMCTGQARSKMRKRRTDARLQQRRGCSSGGGGGGQQRAASANGRECARAPGRSHAAQSRCRPKRTLLCGAHPHWQEHESRQRSAAAAVAGRRTAQRLVAGCARRAPWRAHTGGCVIDANFWNKPRTERWVRGRARGRQVVRSCGKADSSACVAREAGGSPKMSV